MLLTQYGVFDTAVATFFNAIKQWFNAAGAAIFSRLSISAATANFNVGEGLASKCLATQGVSTSVTVVNPNVHANLQQSVSFSTPAPGCVVTSLSRQKTQSDGSYATTPNCDDRSVVQGDGPLVQEIDDSKC